MKKKYLILMVILVFTFVFYKVAFGVNIVNPIGVSTFPELFDKIATFLLEIGGSIATLMILYSAFLFMTGGGDPEKIKRAKTSLLYALIGLAILLSAKGLTLVVKDILSPSDDILSPSDLYGPGF